MLGRILNRAPRPLNTIGHRVIRSLALAYRVVVLSRVVFIGVTGSTGKTTTKELIAAALASRFSGSKSRANSNINIHLTIRRVLPWYKYYVQEIAAAVRGERIPLERPLSLVRPRMDRGALFSHDIAYIKVLQNFNDEHLWKDVFHEHPPIFFGAGFGMGDSSPHLGFAVKGKVTPEYIKSLTFDKRM